MHSRHADGWERDMQIYVFILNSQREEKKL